MMIHDSGLQFLRHLVFVYHFSMLQDIGVIKQVT